MMLEGERSREPREPGSTIFQSNIFQCATEFVVPCRDSRTFRLFCRYSHHRIAESSAPFVTEMANISESAFGDYLQVFHDTLIESAGRFLPARLRGNLHHMARLPCRVRGTVSTQFGVSIDYDPFAPGAALPNSTYSVTSTSQRVEEAIFRQYGATLSF